MAAIKMIFLLLLVIPFALFLLFVVDKLSKEKPLKGEPLQTNANTRKQDVRRNNKTQEVRTGRANKRKARKARKRARAKRQKER